MTPLLVLLVLLVGPGSGFECEFPDRRCGWRWSDGWTLLTAENTSAMGLTAPNADAENNVKGEVLYFSSDRANPQSILKVVSPLFEANTLPTCAIHFALHMYQMDLAVFKIVIKAPNSTWESTNFEGNSRHKWENQTQPINVVTQPFSVIIEIINPSAVNPAHVAIDNIKPIDCYHRIVKYSTKQYVGRHGRGTCRPSYDGRLATAVLDSSRDCLLVLFTKRDLKCEMQDYFYVL